MMQGQQHPQTSSARPSPQIVNLEMQTSKQVASDKQGSRKRESSEMSGVAQNLQMFLQVIQGNGTSIFDHQDQMPRIPPTVSGRRVSRESARQQMEEEEMIVHYPYKRAQSTLEIVQNPSCPSERSNSKKQVRFDIKESLKGIMAQVENDENDSGFSNQVPVYQARPKLSQKKRLEESRSRSKSLEGSKSPQGQRRMPSNDSGKAKPPKLGQFKTRQLPLKYKLNADEMRRKKFGVDQPPPLVQEESTYSTIVSGSGPQEGSRETPNFSVIHSKRDIHELDFQSSPERTEDPPMPSEMNPPELMQIPTSLDVYEEINHPTHIVKTQSPVNRERSMGMIVRNKGIAQSQVFNYQNQRENSQNSSRLSNFQPGVIVRQRSQSPVVGGFQFQNQGKRHSEVPQVGQIVRNSSQNFLQTTQSMPNILLQTKLATSPSSSQLQLKKIVEPYHFISQDTQITDGAAIITTPSLQDSLAERFKNHIFGTVWDILNLPISQAKHQIMQLQSNSPNLRQQLLQVLISSQVKPWYKLAHLRKNLSKLITAQLSEEIEQIIYLRERRYQRLNDLKKLNKEIKRSQTSQHDQLKSELLRDIVDRLNQKLALQVLKLNCIVKRETYLQFEIYYIDYIARDYMKQSINCFKVRQQKNEQKKQYIEQVKSTLESLHLKYLFTSWRELKSRRLAAVQRLQNFESTIESNRHHSLLIFWRSYSREHKLKSLRLHLVDLFRHLKLGQELFLKWSANTLQQNKIKRRALDRVNHLGTDSKAYSGDAYEGRMRDGLKRVQERFKKAVKPWVYRIHELSGAVGNGLLGNALKARKEHGSSQSRGRKKVEMCFRESEVAQANKMPDMNIEVKYNIHQALVMQQNAQRLRAHSAQREQIYQRFNQQNDGTHRRQMSFISDGEKFRPRSSDRIQQKPIINTFFKKLEYENTEYENLQEQIPFVSNNLSGQKLIDRIKSHAFNLQDHKESLSALPYQHHFVVSLRANAHDVVNKEAFTGFTDYIQYGLASRVNKLVFQIMFKTKALSVLFTQWRKRYAQKQFKKSIAHIHTVNAAQQSLIEWHRYIQQRKLWVKDFQRTKHIEKFYNLFRRWAEINRKINFEDEKVVRSFKKRQIFNGWLRHLQRQGDQLVVILKAQRYHAQALLSKSLLALYQSYLQTLRLKQFRSYHCFRTYFKKQWVKKYQRQKKLREVLSKRCQRESMIERDRYIREFEVKKRVMQVWEEKAKERKDEIKGITADTHRRQSLVIKTFFMMKKRWQMSEGVKKLGEMVKNKVYMPAFAQIQANCLGLRSSEIRFKTYQTQVGLARIFMGWKEHAIQMKLSRLFFKKLILKHLYTYVMTKNHVLPKHYRIQRLKALFLKTLTLDVKAKWNDKRSDIILRQLKAKRRERLLKLIFLKLLENVLKGKQIRLVDGTVWDFRNNILSQKAFRAIKRRWLKKKKHRLMNMVARDFSSQRENRRADDLRESLLSTTNDYEIVKLRELKIFEDPAKMLKFHVVAAWKMYIQDKFRRETVLDRFLLFKRRMLNLRCFLGWRSIAKYEQSSGYATTSIAQHSRAMSQSSRKELQPIRGLKLPQIPSTSCEQSSGTKRDSSNRVRSVTHRDSVSHREKTTGVRFADTRQFLFEPQSNMLSASNSSSMHDNQQSGAASATFGMRSIASNYESSKIPPPIMDDTPRECQLRSTQYLQERSKDSQGPPLASSLFDELENIFHKNRKWLDEQREREEFLREMASHYNQRLSQDMNSLRYSQDDPNRFPSLMTLSLTSRR